LPRSMEPPSSSSEAGEAETPTHGHETILVAEDDPLVRDTLCHALAEHGYEVLAAEDGERALALAGDHAGPIALLVTDVVMPKVGGRELSERLKAARPGLRTLFVSGYLDHLPTGASAKEAPDRFLAKPYAVEVLTRRVRELLELHPAGRTG